MEGRDYFTVKELAALLRFSERTIIRIINRIDDPTVIRECAPGTSRVYRRIPPSAVERMKKEMDSKPVPIKATKEMKKKLPPIRLGLGRKNAA
jgi:hypothetical protein